MKPRPRGSAKSHGTQSYKNILAKGEVVRLPVPPLIETRIGQKSELILTMVSDTELLVAHVGKGSCVIDLRKSVSQLALVTLCLHPEVCRQLVDALNIHRREIYG